MTSCEEARFYLEECSLTRLDGDKDGVPCAWELLDRVKELGEASWLFDFGVQAMLFFKYWFKP